MAIGQPYVHFGRAKAQTSGMLQDVGSKQVDNADQAETFATFYDKFQWASASTAEEGNVHPVPLQNHVNLEVDAVR